MIKELVGHANKTHLQLAIKSTPCCLAYTSAKQHADMLLPLVSSTVTSCGCLALIVQTQNSCIHHAAGDQGLCAAAHMAWRTAFKAYLFISIACVCCSTSNPEVCVKSSAQGMTPWPLCMPTASLLAMQFSPNGRLLTVGSSAWQLPPGCVLDPKQGDTGCTCWLTLVSVSHCTDIRGQHQLHTRLGMLPPLSCQAAWLSIQFQ